MKRFKAMFKHILKPRVTPSEARHRLALREGQKRARTEIKSRAERERKGDEKIMSKRKNPEELPPLKIIGRILIVLAFPILFVTILLLKMQNKDLVTIGFLLVTANAMFFIGLIFSHLPQQRKEGKENAK